MDRTDVEQLEKAAAQFRDTYEALVAEIGKRIVGYDEQIGRIVTALLCGGHVLLEGVPGLGKTMIVRTLAEALQTDFSRIQCTPDLMPADVIGTHVMAEDESGAGRFRFQPGPLFSHVVLVDEINRATPKTQSAMLEAMQEKAVTVGGTTHRLEEPFILLGTQNPIEMEGTYPLPEAQLDRFFFKLKLGFLGEEALAEIVNRTTTGEPVQVHPVATGARILQMRGLARTVAIADHVLEHAVRIVVATHPDSDRAPEGIRRYVRYGASPRGIQALVLAGKVRALTEGRLHVGCQDLRLAALPALRHRILLNFEGEAGDVRTEDLVEEVLRAVPETGA